MHWTYVTGLYEALSAPDIAIVLAGDAGLCASRARSRGDSYSRFHSTKDRHHRQERSLFQEAFDMLDAMRYPVHQIEIGLDDPMTVALQTADIITRAREGAR